MNHLMLTPILQKTLTPLNCDSVDSILLRPAPAPTAYAMTHLDTGHEQDVPCSALVIPHLVTEFIR